SAARAPSAILTPADGSAGRPERAPTPSPRRGSRSHATTAAAVAVRRSGAVRARQRTWAAVMSGEAAALRLSTPELHPRGLRVPGALTRQRVGAGTHEASA